MLTFKKLNDIQSLILKDGFEVGLLEKPYGVGYRIYLYGCRPVEPPARMSKEWVRDFIDMTINKIQARERRVVINQYKLRSNEESKRNRR